MLCKAELNSRGMTGPLPVALADFIISHFVLQNSYYVRF
jgi:hypothetical protein